MGLCRQIKMVLSCIKISSKPGQYDGLNFHQHFWLNRMLVYAFFRKGGLNWSGHLLFPQYLQSVGSCFCFRPAIPKVSVICTENKTRRGSLTSSLPAGFC